LNGGFWIIEWATATLFQEVKLVTDTNLDIDRRHGNLICARGLIYCARKEEEEEEEEDLLM